MRTFDDLEKANMERKLLSEKDFSAMTELQYHHHMIAINFEEIAKLKRKMKSLKKKIKKKNLAKGCWIDTENKAPEIYPLFSIKKTDSSTANCLFCKKDFSFEHEIMQKMHELGFPAICLECTEKLTHKPKGKTP